MVGKGLNYNYVKLRIRTAGNKFETSTFKLSLQYDIMFAFSIIICMLEDSHFIIVNLSVTIINNNNYYYYFYSNFSYRFWESTSQDA